MIQDRTLKKAVTKNATSDKFKKYCNPETNKKIKELKLYNLHF